MSNWFVNTLLRLCPEAPYNEVAGSPKRWLWLKRVHISREGSEDIYLQRFILLRHPWGALYLHRFFRGDEDKCLHDHPWAFVSLILTGGYYEETPGGVLTWHRPGSLRFMQAEHRHRVILAPKHNGAGVVWTLVATTGKKRSWGFWTNGGKTWVPWKQFLDNGSQGCE